MNPGELDMLLARLLQHVAQVGGISTADLAEYRHGELLHAALCYYATATKLPAFCGVLVPRSWPFDPMDWRPTNRRGDLLHAAIFCMLDLQRRELKALPCGPVMRVFEPIMKLLAEF